MDAAMPPYSNDSIIGTEGPDFLSAAAGDDTIRGAGGNDTIWDDFSPGDRKQSFGDAGDDRFRLRDVFGAGQATLFGGEGNDYFDLSLMNYSGNRLTIDGGAGADTIYLFPFTRGEQQITIIGFDSRVDVLEFNRFGISGGAGFYSDADGDGAADDLVFTAGVNGGSVRFTFIDPVLVARNGTNGPDSIVGTLLHDTLLGLGGNDQIEGLGGDDRLEGGDGNDELGGGVGDDTLIGGLGRDVLTGGLGNDLINGGSGPDVVQFEPEYSNNGNDTIIGFDLSQDEIYEFGFITLEGLDLDNDGIIDDALAIRGSVTLSFIDLLKGDWLGGPANDLRYGTFFSETMRGGGGNDFLNGFSGNDRLFGDDGADTIWGDEGDDRLEGGLGVDGLHGGIGSDFINGGDGTDTLSGGEGSDRLTGGPGADAFWGSFRLGGWGDTYLPDQWAGNDTITDFDFFEDFVVWATRTRFDVALDLDGDGASDDSRVQTVSSTGAVTQSITFLNMMPVARTGTEGADNLYATPFNETMTGLGGNDTLSSGAGDDWVSGGAGDDTVFGGDGRDELYGGNGNDAITVNRGFSTNSSTFVSGGDGADTIDARNSSGFGIFLGEDGADMIALGSANEFASGGEGNDSFSGSFGFDTIDGGPGIDSLNLNLGPVWQYVAADMSIAYAGYVGIDNGVASSTTQIFNIEVLRLSERNDVLTNWINGPVVYGGGGNDWMADYASASNSAGAGNNDWMFGEDGDDGLYGLEGDDNLYGGMGRDVLVGGSGADRLSGDIGTDWIALGLNAAGTAGDGAADVVLFASRWDSWDPGRAGMDAVLQFETGLDRLDLSAIDANTTLAGDQAFTLGALAAGQAGRLQITTPAGQSWTLVQADVDGDGAADLTVIVYGATGQAMLTAGDFVL